MGKMIEFFARQKLLVNLIIFLVLAVGISTMSSMNREAFPQVNFDMVTIQTIYPGGAPDEIEKLITIPIEKKLREVDGLDKVRSYNVENVSVVVIYIDMDLNESDKKDVVQDIKDVVELVEDLPSKAEKPVVEEVKLDKTLIMNIAVFGKKEDYSKVREAADRLEDFLYDIDGVAEVEDYAFRDKEYLVEVDIKALERNRITLNNVIYAIQQRNLDLPGGVLRDKDKEYVLRTTGQFKNIDELKNTVIMSNDAGFVTRVKDVAHVTDTFEEADTYERINQKNSVVFAVKKKKSADTIKMSKKIIKALKTFSRSKDIVIFPFEDQSIYTENQVNSVVLNAITGFILLAAILFFLLGGRMAMVVMFGFPISFMIGFIGMHFAGITINVISLFGMVMVLGMIVDSGIVVTENTHRYLELGHPKKEAIRMGVNEVFTPLTVTFLCLVSAFMPLAMLTGIIGKFVKAIPIVVILCLGASMITALFFMPAHLNMIAKEPKRKKSEKELKEIEEGYEKGFFGIIQHWYHRILSKALKHRYISLVILFVLFFASIAIVGSGLVKFKFMAGGGEEDLIIKTYMSQGTNLDANLKEIKKIEGIVVKTLRKDEFDAMRVRVGAEDFGLLDPQPGEATHKSTFLLSLTPERDRKRTATEIADDLREKINAKHKNGLFPADMNIKVQVKESGPPVGKPINVEIRGPEFKVLKEIADKYITFLKKNVKGVYDIRMDFEPGKLEYRYKIDEVTATRAGVSVTDAAYALNAAYEGAVATNVRQDEDDIDIRVRFPEWAREKKQSLGSVMVSNNSGGLIPLEKIAAVNKKPGFAFINRLDFKRLIQVQGEVNASKITSIEVNSILSKKFKDIEAQYPGYLIKYGGEQEDTDDSMSDLGKLFLLAIVIIYIILAVYFRSLMLPLVVMCAIPFSLVGVILAVFAHGEVLSFMSTLGIFSLAGVIVSNTLVLVQFINNLRDSGLPLKEALLEGGVIRLRPVLLTSGTTVLGLFPTIYGLGGKDYFVGPLSLAFGYGLIFATIITLILIPCFYHIAEDIKGFFAKIVGFFGFEMSPSIYRKEEE